MVFATYLDAYLLLYFLQKMLFSQSIPSEMEFDPNSNPPCYKTVDEVRKRNLCEQMNAIFIFSWGFTTFKINDHMLKYR